MNPSPPDPQSLPGSPTASRRYGVPFSEVWEALLAALGSLHRWEIRESDPRAGTLTVETANAIGRQPREAKLTLRLDDLGQTCLEIRFEPPAQTLFGPAAAARGRRLIRRLERQLQGRGGR